MANGRRHARRRLRALWWAAIVTTAVAACGPVDPGTRPGGTRCTPGTSRACMLAFDGGLGQQGTQMCNPDRTWAACVGVGTCSGPGVTLPAYARCAADEECGPAGCAACNGYSGVQNPGGFRVCYPYCGVDTDCAPNSPSTDVTPRCVLGQCILLCHASSTCPRDAQCLPWLDADAGAAYPGFSGLCN